MTKIGTLRLVGYVSAFIAGAVCGGAIVYVRTMGSAGAIIALSALSNSGHEAYLSYRLGSYPAAREALLKYIEIAKSHEAALGAQAQSFDVMLSYGRLAVAAEKAGQAENSKDFMRRAIEYRPPDFEPVTEARIRQLIEQLDAALDKRLGRNTHRNRWEPAISTTLSL
jgi:tetratricopeptide (TPR) repeat protein